MAPASRRHPVVEALLDAALNAQRSGNLSELLQQRPRLAHWMLRRHMPIVRGTAGDALDGERALVDAAVIVLRWLVTQLRPDLEPSLDRIDREAWLNQTAWRPMLAVMCHAGLGAIPDFRDRYRRRADEAAVDNLCGLWGVGPSTFYRYLERGKRMLAQIALEAPLGVSRRVSLRRFVQAEVYARSIDIGALERTQWHARQAERALARRDVIAALWHYLHRGNHEAFVALLRDRASDLAADGETDALVDRIPLEALPSRVQFDLWIARAALARTRNAADRELLALERALQCATAVNDRLLVGMAYSALGRYHDPRDADRAFSCYEHSVEYLQGVEPGIDDAQAFEQYLTTLVRLAWLYIARSDPRARAVLERADRLRAGHTLPDALSGMLEQTWGEYWRQAGDLRQALDHKHRALNIFERIGDQRSVLVTHLNLGLLYGENKEFERAIRYTERVLELAARRAVEPAIVVSSHGNLGLIHLWSGDIDQAIGEYQLALAQSLQANLRLHANRTHHNLAEAYYKRYQRSLDPEDERRGDVHAEAVLCAPIAESSPGLVELTRRLKDEVLRGTSAATASGTGEAKDRLIPQESVVHFDQMSDIQRHRAALAVPLAPEAHARARLAIAQAYLTIAVREREAAQLLMQRHGLTEQFAAELAQLRHTYDRALSREQSLVAQWRPQLDDLLDESRCAALVERLLRDGSINKSAYAELCSVSPATASKHLTTLAERGLLQQTGKGPSTRYLLKP
ncbi:MAG TPA: tetratricopeptide repeat protein [Burkholderiaceae bacterium]|nr:tetratricopeptide repeat protein [Burkholderiaceae bacterium]